MKTKAEWRKIANKPKPKVTQSPEYAKWRYARVLLGIWKNKDQEWSGR